MDERWAALIFVLFLLLIIICSLALCNQPYDPPATTVSSYAVDTPYNSHVAIDQELISGLIAAADDVDLIWFIDDLGKSIGWIQQGALLNADLDTVHAHLERDLAESCASVKVNPNWALWIQQSDHSVPLRAGLPVPLGHGTTVFSSVVLGYSKYPSDEYVILPPIVAGNAGTQQKIPQIIHSTFQTRVVPKALAESAQQWRRLNPEYTWRYWTARQSRQCIQEHFDPKFVEAYDTLYPGAFKADLWRCCALWLHGGVYADIKLYPLVPLSELISADTDAVLTMDYRTFGIVQRYVYNAFFAFPARHPLVRAILDRIELNVRNRLQPVGPVWVLDITGPGVWRDELMRMTGLDHSEGRLVSPTLGSVNILGHSFQVGQPGSIVDGTNRQVILTQPPIHCGPIDYYAITGKRRYDRERLYVE